MIFQNIDGKHVNEVDMSDLVDFFVEHIFFKFMDSGRSGLQAGTQDLVETSIFRAQTYFKAKYGEQARKFDTREFFDELLRDAQRRVFDGFIKGGSAGSRDAIFAVMTSPSLYQ